MHRLFIDRAQTSVESSMSALPSTGRLSRREQEIVRFVVAGLCNRKIATKLRITGNTVKAHLVNVFRKLNVHDRTQLAARVREIVIPGDGVDNRVRDTT